MRCTALSDLLPLRDRVLDLQLFLCVARPRSDTEKKLQSVQRCSVLTLMSSAGERSGFSCQNRSMCAVSDCRCRKGSQVGFQGSPGIVSSPACPPLTILPVSLTPSQCTRKKRLSGGPRTPSMDATMKSSSHVWRPASPHQSMVCVHSPARLSKERSQCSHVKGRFSAMTSSSVVAFTATGGAIGM